MIYHIGRFCKIGINLPHFLINLAGIKKTDNKTKISI